MCVATSPQGDSAALTAGGVLTVSTKGWLHIGVTSGASKNTNVPGQLKSESSHMESVFLKVNQGFQYIIVRLQNNVNCKSYFQKKSTVVFLKLECLPESPGKP